MSKLIEAREALLRDLRVLCSGQSGAYGAPAMLGRIEALIDAKIDDAIGVKVEPSHGPTRGLF